MKDSTAWTHNKIIKLIEFYKHEEHMWRKNNPQYYNRADKIKTNNTIGEMLGFSGEEVKKKWISLRQIFMKEVLSKNAANSRNGRIKIKEWRYFKLLIFLLPEETDIDKADPSNTEDSMSQIHFSDSEKSSSTQCQTTKKVPSTSQVSSKKRKNSFTDSVSGAENEIYDKCIKELSKEDNFHMFGAQIENDLRRIKSMDENICFQLEIQIREVILEAFKKVANKNVT